MTPPSMTRLALLVLAGLAVAFAVANAIGGAVGGGVMAGYLAGGGTSGLSAMLLKHMAEIRPEKAWHAFILAFLFKLLFLVGGAFFLRFDEAAGARADWQSFLVAFALAVCFVLPLGAREALRTLQSGRASKA